ncbi:MAG TPA: DUF481 domain-containing protein [Kofleriaceae bacterium]|nr:DUF481 domain-containing protein [Kofleriaceae bacterium]
MIRRRRVTGRPAAASAGVCLLGLALAARAGAQPPVLPLPQPPAPAADPTQPKFTFTSKEDAAALAKAAVVEWKLAAQGSLLLSTGNSRATAIGAGLSASRKASRNKFTLEGAAAYARSRLLLATDANGNGTIEPGEISRPSQTTTRSWLARGRYDRYLTAANALYGAASIGADEPAGKQLVGGGQVGYSRQVFRDGVHLLVAEAGYDYTYEDQVLGDGVSIHSLRVFAGYTAKLSADTGFEVSAEELSNLNHLDGAAGEVGAFEDNRVNGKLALTTKLLLDISFRVAFEARYDHAPAPRPPFALPYADGFTPLAEELDTRTEATLIVSFL